MQAYHRAQLPPTGAAHALSVRLTPLQDSATSEGTVVSHLITARSSVLQLWEVRETEEQGQPSSAKLHHVLTRRLHGTVTSLARIRTLASKTDGADRVLVSFTDAKISLLEWTPSAHDLLPVSLHTFEKLPQVVDGRAKAATDPASRLSVLLLPSNTGGDGTLAILPFFSEEIDLESLGVDAEAWGPDGVASIPYAPSHLLPLASLTAGQGGYVGPSRSSTLSNALSNAGGPPPIRNVIDMAFLPGFNEPTLAILYAPEPTWTGRLENVNHNCLVSLVTLASGSGIANSSQTTAVIIATSPALPHSSLSVHPCPPDLGGTLIVTANGLLHLEQGGKVVGVASNGWFGKDWSGTGSPNKNETTVREELEGARVVFIANNKAIVFTKSGSTLELTLQTSGRSVSSMKLHKVGRGVAASCVERIRGSKGRFGEDGYVFVGSEVGESTLVRWEIGTGGGLGAGPISLPPPDVRMDVDDDDEDIYGSSDVPQTAPMPVIAAAAKLTRSLTLSPCDVLDTYGAIRSMVVGLVEDDSPPELVAATGGGPSAGITIFHRSIAPRKRRKLDLEGIATAGLWDLPLRGVAQMSVLIKSNLDSTGIISSDRTTETTDVTLAAGSVRHGEGIVRVTPNAVLLLDASLTTRQSFSLTHGAGATRAIVSDPFVAAFTAKRAVEVAVIDNSTGTLMSQPLPVEECCALAFFIDSSNVVPLVKPAAPKESQPAAAPSDVAIDEEDDLYTSAPRRPIASDTAGSLSLVLPPSIEAGAISASNGKPAWQWLSTVTKDGRLEIFLLPSMQSVFSSAGIALFPEVIEDGSDIAITDDIDPDDIVIDRIVCASIGQTRSRPHLLIHLTNGATALYEAVPSISAANNAVRQATLGVRFVKVTSRRLPLTRRAKRGAAEDELPPPKREFVPFSDLQGFTGLFVTGEDPLWIIATDHGPARIFDHAEKGVFGFSRAAIEPHYIVQTKTGAFTAILPSDVCFDRELPFSRAPKDRCYASITFDLDSGLYVAGVLHDTVFMNFDEEGQAVFTNDSPELVEPRNYRSSVELILPGSCEAIHGYEFRPNEFISTLKTVSLATKSTGSGRKDFIAVGTTVYRAEDLAARGGIYLFEVISTVPSPTTPHIDHQLKLLFFEDTKSVVGNLCDINGHLIMSMGQKLYARAFEQDEVLLAVGFLDVGVHVTSLQSMKNFLLIGDALQSVTLVAFQEDPYKLVLLGRDYRPARVASANFLINDGKVSFVVGDVSGVLRLFEYEPTNIASHAGQRLLCRTEYYAGAEAESTLLFAKRTGTEVEVKQNGILYGGIDGSLYSLVPVRDIVFKRLQLLQTQMTRHVQHFAGLNPRGHRIVKNDSVSRAITKGILDGELLADYEALSLDKQTELAKSVKTDPDTVLANLKNLASLW